MTKQDLLNNLEFWIDCLENPTYNSLEVGFRHTPLSKDEQLERFRTECNFVREAAMQIKSRIENEGIE